VLRQESRALASVNSTASSCFSAWPVAIRKERRHRLSDVKRSPITVFQNQVPNSKSRAVIHFEELQPEQQTNYCPSNEPITARVTDNYRPRVGVHTPGAGHCHSGVGAMSRCPRFENASMYHILHAASEGPVRISRSCLDGSEGSCGPATTLRALPPRSARLMAACELIERLARVEESSSALRRPLLAFWSAAAKDYRFAQISALSSRIWQINLHAASHRRTCVSSGALGSKSHAKEAPRSVSRAQTRPELAAATRR